MTFFGTLWQKMTSSSYGHCTVHPAFDPTCVACQFVRRRGSDEMYPVSIDPHARMNFDGSPDPSLSPADRSDSSFFDSRTSDPGTSDSATSGDASSSFDASDSGFSGFDGGDSGGGGSSGDF